MGILLIRSLSSLLATLTAYATYKVARFIYLEWSSPVKVLPGPPSTSLLYGNMKEIWAADNPVLHEKWVEEYGPTITYRALFGLNRLYTTDLKALNHIFMNSYIYQKPESARYIMSRVIGQGLLVVEEDKHKQQRKIMNPAFSAAHIRELTEIFIEKSIQVRDIWAMECFRQGGTAEINVMSWLARATLDMIGLGGFNYNLNSTSTDSKRNELAEFLATLFQPGMLMGLLPLLRGMVPVLRWVPLDWDARSNQAQETMNRIGKDLIRDAKTGLSTNGEGNLGKKSFQGKDLLSLLVKANMAADLPESHRMSDEDVLAQVPTFLVAGHETTSTGTTWALYALTQNKDAQSKLRKELLAVPTATPTMDELHALPYLDAVVRETLRIHAPIDSVMRVATRDDVIPLNTPFTDRNGMVHHSIAVKAGQTIFVPVLAINRSKSIWGEDAHEFRPERWRSIPEAASDIPGAWGNLLTFLGGSRACIGYRFSLTEIKALLFTLVRAFEFDLAVAPEDIVKKFAIVSRPVLRTDPKAGNRMPLLVKPLYP